MYVLVNNRPQIAGRRMVLSPRTFRTWESILRYMSSTLGIAVRTLYDLQSETEIDRYAGLAGLEVQLN